MPARRLGQLRPHLDHACHWPDQSKDAAAGWALAQLPLEHRPALQHARQLYLDCPYSKESWSDALQARVRPHADHVLAELDRLVAGD
ncbi:aminoglycoside adenylyltransferase domain-containing protein [Streptomyces collinus]|uniref:aminoglycoside adenylyltransferase domain-containing protein n=1 Tax=Streptomyces collinus TaxID=42684 RepID=UPI003EBD4A98